MKTTIDLPDELVRRLKLRAVQDGRKLKDVAAEFLRNGLEGSSLSKAPTRVAVLKDEKTGLPVIDCGRGAGRNQELTPEEVAAILTEQEGTWTQWVQGGM